MKKLLSFFMAVSMIACLFVPVASAAATYPVYTDKLYQAFENEADLNNLYKWDITTEFSNEGAFGSSGAAKLFSSSVNGGAEYRMYLTEGKMYRFSVLVKPLDFTLSSATLILLTDATEGGSGWEQVPMSVGTANNDGYIPVTVEYRISDRVYPGSSKPVLDKKEGAQTRVVFRMNKANITYLLDEVIVEPVDYVAFENFNNAGNIPHKVTQPTASTDGTSETYSANILAHNQSNYNNNQSGFAHIVGSNTKGAYFPNLTLMPVTTYRISADIVTNSSYDVTVYPYYYLASSEKSAIAPSGNKVCGSGILVPKGTRKHVEFLFRTEGTGTTAYAENGITFDKFGIVSSSPNYVIWDCDNLKVEKVDDQIICNGDMENVTLNSDNTKLLADYVCPAGQTPVMQRDGSDTTFELVNDGTNGDRGTYLKMHFVGTKSENAVDKTSNNRRGVWYVNLKKGTTHRISFWAKLDTDDDSLSYSLAAMHNMGKVDANGLVSGEAGWDTNSAAYGYIAPLHSVFKINNKWQHIDVEFTTQNRQQVAQLLIGLNNFQIGSDITMAIDEFKIEEIGTKFNDPTITYADGVLKATEQTGAQVGTVTNKTYTFYVSNDGVNYAKAGESTDGTFATRTSDVGKYMKAVVSATKADGTEISAETKSVRITGYALKFTSDLSGETVTATAVYYPENGEVKTFDGIIALYNGKELVAADSFTSENNVATMSIANDGTATNAKIFAWNTVNGAIPVAKNIEFK